MSIPDIMKAEKQKPSMIYECVCGVEEDTKIETTLKLNDVKLIDKISLGLLNFVTLNRAKPGIFIAPYLLMKGWRESSIGVVLFFNGVCTLLLQTPAGEIVDYTKYKRYIVALANFIATITCIIIISSNSFNVILFAMCLQGFSIAFIFPAIYGITLGMVGSTGIIAQVPINETCLHSGNAAFALLSGFIVYLTSDESSAFIICVIKGFVCILVVLLMDESKIDHQKARGLEHDADISSMNVTDHNITSHGSPATTTAQIMTYSELFKDQYLLIFFFSCLLFHFGNAAMLPLLSQVFFLGNDETGFEFAALSIIIAQISMVFAASFAGRKVSRYGTKKLFLYACLIIPLRAVFIVLLLTYHDNKIGLLSTQILDGIAGGIFGVVSVLIAENLSRGTGRFNLVIGMVKTMESLGGSFSNLIGESIAEHSGYRMAFIVLGISSFLPFIVYQVYVPEGVVDNSGVIVETLSISSRHGMSNSTHSSAGMDSKRHVNLSTNPMLNNSQHSDKIEGDELSSSGRRNKRVDVFEMATGLTKRTNLDV
jgi:MFS family permease